MSLSLGVSSVTSAVAKQLSNPDPLACGTKLSSVVFLVRVRTAWPTERISFGIWGNLHDGKLCLPPNLTHNKL